MKIGEAAAHHHGGGPWARAAARSAHSLERAGSGDPPPAAMEAVTDPGPQVPRCAKGSR